MSARSALSSGAHLLASTLSDAGIARVYGVPQPLSLRVWEALEAFPVRRIVPVSDLGGAFMALGDGRLERTPSALLLTPTPGLDQSLSAIGEARLAGVPMLVVVTLPGSAGSEAFERLPLRPFKEALLAESVTRIPELLRLACRASREGRGGPVALLVPEALLATTGPKMPVPPLETSPLVRDPEEAGKIERALKMIAGAQRLAILAGSGALLAANELGQLAENLGAPCVATALGRGALGDDHPLQAGFGSLTMGPRHVARLMKSRDLVIAVGLGRIDGARKGLPIIQIDARADTAGRAWVASDHLLISSDPRAALPLLAAAARRAPEAGLRDRIQNGKRKHAASLSIPPSEKGVQPELFFTRLRSRLPRDAVLVLDGGRHRAWALHAFAVFQPNTFHAPATDDALGLATPAAIGAKLAQPERSVVAVSGHGTFLVTAIELQTAVDQRLALPVFVLEDCDDSLAQIRMSAHARKAARGVDFRALAQAVGARNVKIENDLALDAGLDAALAAADRPTLCHVRILYERPTPYLDDKGRGRRLAGVRTLARSLTARLWRRS